ncbi:MAG: hypothetical protein JOZ07_15360 [Solirubrobacterales bacterium]|nr:hypothetical protein [Solirubrobacterales bacterium]
MPVTPAPDSPADFGAGLPCCALAAAAIAVVEVKRRELRAWRLRRAGRLAEQSS